MAHPASGTAGSGTADVMAPANREENVGQYVYLSTYYMYWIVKAIISKF